MTAHSATADPRALRRAFGTFATGVTITATRDAAGAPVGFTANSFASVSLDPPLLLVCLARTATSSPIFSETGHFAVSILAEGQRDLSTTFATRGADKFAGVAWRAELTGSPVLDGAVAWFDCHTHELVPAGDHLILIGRVMAFDCAPGAPLGYCRGAYVRFGLDGAAFSEPQGGVRVAAIVERDGHILLRETGTGLSLPAAAAFGPPSAPQTLQGLLRAAGSQTDLPFVFASYDAAGAHHVVYRAILPPSAKPPKAGWRFVALSELPAAAMPAHEAELLRLYSRERDAYAYGRYVGDAVTWATDGP